nr:sigma-70 region 4 domain-containing protein [Motilibacter deserti]
MAQLKALVRHGPVPDVPAPSPDVVAVRAALETLPRDQRAALVLHYFSGLRVREIADLLGVAEGTVKARLSRGRTALAPLLRNDEEDPSWTRS